MKKYLVLSVLFLTPCLLHAQAPAIEWEKCYGGTYDDGASRIIQTTDSGFIIAGSASSDDFDIRRQENHYALKHDFWVVKINAHDSIQWQVMLGGTGEDYANSIILTYDGGYLVSGETESDDGDVDGNHGGSDYWVVKLDSKGMIQWQKPLGGSGGDNSAVAFQTTDSNYIVAGYTGSVDGDITGGHGGLWVVKLDRAGSLLWQKVVLPYSIQPSFTGGSVSVMPFIPTSDGGFAVAGIIDTSGLFKADGSAFDGIIIKYDDTGATQWTHVIGGNGWDGLTSIIQTKDGGYALAGFTSSRNEQLLGHGVLDFWIVKVDHDGFVEWQKSMGGSAYDIAASIVQTKDGGYAVTGWTGSNDGDVKGYHGGYDFWLVKLNSFGMMEWQKTMGGSNDDHPLSVIQTKDGGYAVAGVTASSDGDVTGMHGENDYWVVKLMPVLAVPETPRPTNENIFLSPNPGNGIGKISYNLSVSSFVKIEIFNPLGQLLRKLINSKEEAGIHEHEFDITDLPSGSYFFRIEMDGKSVLKAMELIK